MVSVFKYINFFFNSENDFPFLIEKDARVVGGGGGGGGGGNKMSPPRRLDDFLLISVVFSTKNRPGGSAPP